MDHNWLEKQKEEIGLALANQGIRLVVPVGKGKRGATPTPEDKSLASYMDHTLLKPTAAQTQITALCEEALRYQFASVCVNPVHVPTARSILQGSDVAVCTVVGFPLGATSTLAKVCEARTPWRGAFEIDMVINIGGLLEANYARVYSDIRAVRDAVPGVLKVILETGYLSKEQIVQGCILAKMAGADFVKTSTGFALAAPRSRTSP